MTAVIAKVVEHGTFASSHHLARLQAGLQSPNLAAGARQKLLPIIEVTLFAVLGDKRPTIRLGGSWFEADYSRAG